MIHFTVLPLFSFLNIAGKGIEKTNKLPLKSGINLRQIQLLLPFPETDS